MKISHPENIDINTISTIIFDWGGVITNISPQVAMNAFKTLGHQRIEDFFDPNAKEDLFFKLEKGLIAPSEVYDKINHELKTKVKPALIKEAYCAMLLDTPGIRLELLKKLRKQFQLYLLSNTNILHVTYYNDLLRKKFQLDFPSLFHKIFYSHELGLRKPGIEIFEKVISENKIEVSSTLFLDDTKTNIASARSLGVNTLLIDEMNPIEKIFADWL